MGVLPRQDGRNVLWEGQAQVVDHLTRADHGGTVSQIAARRASRDIAFEPVPESFDMRISGNREPANPMRMRSVITIIASAGHGGTITPSARVAIGYGLSKMFAITPRWGYSIVDVQVDGVSVGSVLTYIFSNLSEDHTISATFKKDF
jgi:hypothetical protein